MKKTIISLITCIVMTLMALSVKAQTYVYTSSGKRMTEYQYNSAEYTAMDLLGAIVSCDGSAFDKRLVFYNAPFNSYSVFGNSTNSETLTLGIIENKDYYSGLQRVQNIVYRQISYIESIGGTMTGYTIQGSAVNISWDVAGTHHYARFENDWQVIGYYDYMFYDCTQETLSRIRYMNADFGVSYEFQHEFWKPYIIYG